MNQQILMMLCIFGGVAAVGYLAASLLFSGDEKKALRNRLKNATPEHQEQNKTGVPLIQRIGQAASEPFMPKTREKQSSIRRSLALAGIYSPGAIKLMTGAKVILLGGGLLLGYVVGSLTDMLMLGLSVGGLIGYLGPSIWLKMRIRGNQKALGYGLPDAIDLMVVCVEAGLTVDAAMQRVGQEMAIAHPAIAREFGITHMETRVGLARTEALKNLGQRTGAPCLQEMASMLTQAERFGTSIAQALRIHAESLRLARQYAAEEQAAKASVKMSFPLVLFIFPATFLILAGPTIIGLLKSDLFK